MGIENIKHLVVLMLENRSFDHMLGFLASDEYKINGLKGDEANRDSSGEPVRVSSDARYGGDFDPDPGHDFSDVMLQMFGTESPETGQGPDMSGFVIAYERKCNGNISRAHNIMKCFAPEKLPALCTLARQFAICDRWFCSIPGPTLPNRLFAHCGTAGGRLDMSPEYIRGLTTVYEVLDRANVGSTIYSDGWSSTATFPYLLKYQDQFYGTIDDFYQDCADNVLPKYCFIEPRYSSGFVNQAFRAQNDQHPDSDVFEGEKLIRRVYEAIRGQQQVWESTVLLVTYDEHGGLFDHARPPKAPAPDNRTSQNPAFDFTQLGVRVPAVVVSPFIDAGTIINDADYDHSSIIASALDLFSVPREKMIAIKGNTKANPPTADIPNARVAAASNFLNSCVKRDKPRDDKVQFPNMDMSAAKPKPPALLNDLHWEYVKMAAELEQGLKPQYRTGTDPSAIHTDQQADAYVSQVLAMLKTYSR